MFIFYKRLTILTLQSIFITTLTFSQDPEIPFGTPQSAPSFYHSNEDQNVELSTGGMTQVFPIASLNGKSIGTNVNAVYTHGQGIRVNEIGSPLGIGFDLYAGGTIIREVRGVPDDNGRNPIEYHCSTPEHHYCTILGTSDTKDFDTYPLVADPIGQHYLYGWFDKFDFHRIRAMDIVNNAGCTGLDTTWIYPISYLDDLNMGELVEEFKNDSPSQWWLDEEVWRRLRYYYFYNVPKGLFDTEPDIFRFQFGNYKGSFVFKPDGTPILTENMNIDIEPAIGPQSGSGTAWIFTTPDGTKYIFTNSDTYREKSIIYSETGYVDRIVSEDCVYDHDESESVMEFYSKWHLSKIESVLNETFEFEYEVGPQMAVTSYSQIQEQIYDLGGNYSCWTSGIENYPYFIQLASFKFEEYPKVLRSIVFRKNEEYAGGINFLFSNIFSYYDNHPALESVQQFNYKNQLVRKVNFNYTSLIHDRIKLESISQSSVGNFSKDLVTMFEYFEDENLPARNSAQQDFLGFYNGASSNNNLIPEIVLKHEDYVFLDGTNATISGANRNPELAFCRANVLKKIIYPEGGYKEFEYELNEYYNNDLSQNEIIGGLRLKSVKIHDDIDNDNNLLTYYEYELEGTNNSSGEIPYQRLKFDVNNYDRYLENPSNFYTQLNGQDALDGIMITRYGASRRYEIPDFIRYSRVVERQEANGYTEYLYTSHSDFADVPERYQKIYQGINSSAPSFVTNAFTEDRTNDTGSPFTDNSFLRGLLKSLTAFNENNEIVRRVENEYEIVDENNSVTSFRNQFAGNFLYDFYCTNVYTDPSSDHTPHQAFDMGASTNVHNMDYYYHRDIWKYLLRSTTKTYDVGTSDYVASETQYYYEVPGKLSWKKSFGSDGKDIVSTYKYSSDIQIPSGTLSEEAFAIQRAVALNQLQLPVESVNFIDDGTDLKVLSSQLITYKRVNGLILPYQVFGLDNSTLLSDFEEVSIANSGSPKDILKDPRYRLLKTLTIYNNNGNLISEDIPNGTTTSYIYAGNHSQPVAIFKNGLVGFDENAEFPTYNVGIGKECSYTGFEDIFIDGWDTQGANLSSDSYTGEKSLVVVSNLSTNDVEKIFEPESDGYYKTYKLSARVKTPVDLDDNGGEISIKAIKTNGSDFCSSYDAIALKTATFSNTANEWKYIEVELDGRDIMEHTPSGCGGSLPATGFHLIAGFRNLDADFTHTILLDDIRFHPTDVMVETMVYNSLFGKVSTVCDPNGKPKLFMEYDGFGRNTLILDKDKNVRQYNEFIFQDPNVSNDLNKKISYWPKIALSKSDFLDKLQNNLLEFGDFVKSVTYIDGNGRPIQTIGCNQAPFDGTDYRDIVSFIDYDELGRAPISYLSYVDESDDGSFKDDVLTKQLDFYAAAPMVFHSDYPFKESVFDGSPLGQIVEQGAPGESWQLGNGHTTKTEIQCNEEDEVLLWEFNESGPGAEAVTYYEPNQLFKKVMIDEQGLTSQIFTDVFGRTILVQSQIKAELDPNDKSITFDFTEGNLEDAEEISPTTICTYYVYNELNQLVYTISPAAFEELDGTYSFVESDNVFEKYIYASRYDIRGRVYAQKAPGSGWSYSVYDQLDRPVLTQTANQTELDQWNFVKYDLYGRIILSGLFNSTDSRGDLQEVVSTWPVGNWEQRDDESGSILGYSNAAFPEINIVSGDQILTVQYYDDYDFDLLGREFEPSIQNSYNEKVKGLLTGSLVKVMDSDPDNYLLSINYYDDQYRPIQNHVQNHLSGWDVYENEYNFDQSLNKSIRLHYANSVSFPVVIKSRFEYDHIGRLVNEYMSVGAGKSPPEKLVGHYEYNILGQLIKKDLDFKPATSDFLQHIDYRYNIRGWLSSINNAELENDGSKNLDDLDVFGEEIYYDQTEAITVDNTEDNPFVPLNIFNGNISAIRWKSKAPDITSDSKPENLYCYRYDDLNRLTAAYYAKSEINMPGFFNTDYHLFNEKLSYDLDGNIRSLDRQHSDGAMDELLYTYDGHKLMEVTDAITAQVGNGFNDANTSGDDYSYDSNGNLTEDLNKALTLQYNHLNLPTIIQYGTDELSYLYDATGRKLRTIYPDSKVHDYVSGIEYEDSELLFLNASFGRVKATGPQEFCSSNFAYEYFINDHLGSVRAVITREENAPEHNYSATMETAVATQEEAMFYNIDITSVSAPLDLQTYTSSYNAALTNSTGEPIGPAKVLQVQEGDKISIDVKYFYDAYTGGNTPRSINDILAQLANFFILSGTVAPPGLESSWAASTFTSNSAVSAFINTEITSSDPVLAYLAYITLDENFNFIADASGILKADDPDVPSDLNSLDIIMPKNGYIYIYVANESPTDVYFDNLQIIHKKSNVLELSDYYPYGLRNETLCQTSLSFDPLNSYKYQDKELQTALGLNTHEFSLRHYDATLGRWSVQDPMSQFFNPYLAMGNNPVNVIDPTGGIGFQTQGNPKNVGEMTNSSEYQHYSGGGLPGGPIGWGSWGVPTMLNDPDGYENYVTLYFEQITGTNHYGIGADGKSNTSFFENGRDALNYANNHPGSTASYNSVKDEWEINSENEEFERKNLVEDGDTPPSKVILENTPYARTNEILATTIALSSIAMPPLAGILIGSAASLLLYEQIIGFGDKSNWVEEYQPVSESPLNRAPQGFDPRNPPTGWKGPVKWAIVGGFSYKIYKGYSDRMKEIGILPYIVAPPDKTNVVQPQIIPYLKDNQQ